MAPPTQLSLCTVCRSRKLEGLQLPALQVVFDDLLHAAIFAGVEDQNGIYLPSERPIHRLGLALEPFSTLDAWVAAERLDALFLHRPWQLTPDHHHHLAEHGIGVLAYHLAFDERLTTGFNPVLAERCGWGPPEFFGQKEGRPLGMACALPKPLAFEEFAARMENAFGGPLHLRYPNHLNAKKVICDNFPVRKIAVVGAMTDRLVRDAHAAGVDAYVTGQFRHPAVRAVEETGLGVVELGHHRSEIWGLHTLAALLRMQIPSLQIVLPEVI